MRARAFAARDGAGSPRGLGRGEMALTTASAPLTTLATSSAFVASPFTRRTRGSGGWTAAGSRTTPVTSWPRLRASFTTRRPMFPVAPMTTIFMTETYRSLPKYRAPAAPGLRVHFKTAVVLA